MGDGAPRSDGRWRATKRLKLWRATKRWASFVAGLASASDVWVIYAGPLAEFTRPLPALPIGRPLCERPSGLGSERAYGDKNAWQNAGREIFA